MSAPRWRGWLAAGAIFLLGAAVGGAGMTLIGFRLVRQILQNPASARGAADRAAARIGADLAETLQLTSEESSHVQSILNQSAADLKALRVRAAADAVILINTTTEKIAAALPPEKHADLHRVIARRYSRLGLSPPTPNHAPP